MNRVYRVVFNKATQTWVAVAEFAKAHGKSAKTVGSGLVAATLAISSVAQAAVAEGDNATAATSAVAVGDNAAAVTEESIAIGANTKAGAENNFSNWANLINPATKQKFTSEQELRDYFAKNQQNNNPVYRAVVGKRANIAIGYGAVAEGGRNISIGEAAGVGTADNWNIHNVNIGSEAGQNSKKDYSVAVGYRAGALTDAQQLVQEGVVDGGRHPSVLIGKQAGEGTVAYGTVAIGQDAGKNISDIRSVKNIAIGSGAGEAVSSNDGRNATFPGFGAGANTMMGAGAGRSLSGDGNVAIGNLTGSGTVGDNNIMMGHLAGSGSTADRSIIMGSQTGWATGTNDRNVLIGNFVNGGQKANVATAVGIGSNVVVTGSSGIALGNGANATALNAIAQGTLAKAEGGNAIAIGVLSEATQRNTIAQGTYAKATAEGAISIGTGVYGSDVTPKYNTASGKNSVAIGYANNVSGAQSIAIGTQNTVTGEGSGAFGDPTIISGTGSYSVGNNNTIATNDTFVVGSNANSVFLGKDVAYTAQGTTSDGLGAVTEPVTVGGTLTYGDFAGKTPVGVVSVGDVGKERRIQNMAAGLISATSTDAINGSQLYATNAKLGNVAATVVNNFGGNATLNKDGNITYTNIGDTGKDTIHEAVAEVKNQIDTANTNITNIETEIDKGLNFKGNIGGAINKKLGDTLTIKGELANDQEASAKNIRVDNESSQLIVKIAENPEFKKVTATNSIVIGNVTGNSTTLTSTTDGLNVGGDKITNVGDAINNSDAVNLKQLNEAKVAATTKVAAGENIAVKENKNTDGSITYTVSTAKDLKVDNITINKGFSIGDVTVTNTPITVNGNTVNNINEAINKTAEQAFSPLTFTGDTGSTKRKLGETFAIVAGNAADTSTKNLKTAVTNGQVEISMTESPEFKNITATESVVIGDVTGNSTTLTSTTDGLNVGGDKITNVGDATNDSDAVNLKLLREEISKVNITAGASVVEAGQNIEVASATANGVTTYTVSTAKDLTVDSVTAGDTVINNDGVKVGDDVNLTNKGLSAGDISVTVDGINAGNTVITNVATGKADTDAVNLKQMNDAIANINTSIAASKEEVQSDDRSVTVTVSQNANNANVYDLSVNTDGVTLTKDEATGAIKVNTTTLVDADGDGRVDAPSTADSDKLVNAGDIVKIVNSSGFTLTAQGKNGSLVTSGATVDMNNTDGNIVIEKSSGDNNVTYNLAKDLKLDSVTTGDTVVNNDGITISNGNTNGQSVSITKDGLNNGGNRITNVAPGAISAGSSDVINGDQLYRLTKDMDQRFGDTYNRIDELNANRKAGSASAMAAAGLPQAYREGQSGIVAALGQYEGETGVAIGFTSISDNGKWLFRGAYATNTQKENSANLGLGYFW